jgi:predicted kinase
MQARLVIVTGLPCTGKSTVARRLAERYRHPVFAKDAFKEALFDTLGTGDREWSRRLSKASFAVLFAGAERVLAAGGSAIVEGNFRPEHAAVFERVRNAHGVSLVQVLCGGAGPVLIERFEARVRRRSRHPGHVDALALEELRASLARGWAEPLPFDCRTVRFDSTAGGVAGLDALFRALDDAGGSRV